MSKLSSDLIYKFIVTQDFPVLHDSDNARLRNNLLAPLSYDASYLHQLVAFVLPRCGLEFLSVPLVSPLWKQWYLF